MEAAGKHNLPQRIYHLAHPGHKGLVLCQCNEDNRLEFSSFFSRKNQECSSCCSICLNDFENGDYFYACGWDNDCSSRDYCHFTVDIPCISIKARVDFRGHKHPLFFIKRVNPSRSQKCQSCQGYTSDLMLRCLRDDCDYNLHLSCGPLPVAIRYHHSGHDLTLTLMDSLVDGADPEDCWCDICEERRDPRKCVYHSEDPPFSATIDCLLPQIVGAIQGDHGDVRLRTVRKHILGNVNVYFQESTKNTWREEHIISDESITFDDLFDWLPREDWELIMCAFIETKKGWTTEGIDINNSVIPFKFSDEAFEQFKEHAIAITGSVDLSSPLSAHWFQEKPLFTKVGSYWVHTELEPLYQQLIDKHGDFTAGCPLSPMGKATILTFLLKSIQSTQGLQICEITGDHLVSLQFKFEALGGKLGIDDSFARDNLEKMACAVYALKFLKARDDTTTDLTQKIEQLERDIPEDKAKIEALREQYRRGKESVFVKQCLAQASALKWKNAGEFLGLDEVE